MVFYSEVVVVSNVGHAEIVIFCIPIFPRHGIREGVECFRLIAGEGNRFIGGAVEQVVSDLSLILSIDESLVECDQFHAGMIVSDGEIREDSD